MADGYSKGWRKYFGGNSKKTYEEKQKEWKEQAYKATYASYYTVIEQKDIGVVYETPIASVGRKHHYISIEQMYKRSEENGEIIYHEIYRVDGEDGKIFYSLDEARNYYDSFKPKDIKLLEKEFIKRLDNKYITYYFNYIYLGNGLEAYYKNTEEMEFIKELCNKKLIDLDIEILEKHIDNFNKNNKPVVKKNYNHINKKLKMKTANLGMNKDYGEVRLYFDFEFEEGLPFNTIFQGDYNENTAFIDSSTIIPLCNFYDDYRYLKLERFIEKLESNINSNKNFLNRLFPKNKSPRFDWDKALQYRRDYYEYLEQKIVKAFNENKL